MLYLNERSQAVLVDQVQKGSQCLLLAFLRVYGVKPLVEGVRILPCLDSIIKGLFSTI